MTRKSEILLKIYIQPRSHEFKIEREKYFYSPEYDFSRIFLSRKRDTSALDVPDVGFSVCFQLSFVFVVTAIRGTTQMY